MKQNETLEVEDTSWLNDYEGAGQESLKDSSVRSTPFLGLVQGTSACLSDENPEGTWRNSASGKNYGKTIKVIPLAFHTVWAEKEAVAPYRTLARYVPHSIETDERKQTGKNFPKLYNKATGNEIVEQYIYAVLLPDFPEDGILFFNPSAVSMKTCRCWNSVLFGSVLSNGAKAPIFKNEWLLVAELVQNPQQPNKTVAKITRIVKDIVTPKELFMVSIKPQLDTISQTTLRIANSIEVENEASE